ncbi:MAG: hypothetical protein QXS41_03155 [Candidatus Woesearchaeota archaeon]
MGFDTIASSLIMFIAVLSVSVMVVSLFNNYVTQGVSALNYKKNQIIDRIDTDFKIVEIKFNYSESVFYVYLLNTGKTLLKPENFVVFVDGNYISKEEYSLQILNNFQNPSLLDKNEILFFNITRIPSENEKHEIRIVYSNGAYDYSIFN